MVWTPWLVRVRLTIAFADTGDGVAADNLDRVLERALLRWRIGGHAEPRQRYWSVIGIGQIARASSVNAVATRSEGQTSVASS
ncbi:hypothetical protein ACQP1S_12375 [Micromonospora matsumotoense]|uniref:hypothetical protein n=1 Tax=Micromonospora matsumotoense TaxID=121616 RepID=UPI003D8EE916